MTLFLKNLACSALLGAVALAGCTTSSTSSTTSTLTGSIDQSTFPAAVASITVARNDGTTTTAPVLDDGSFSILLESGGTYRLLLSADGAGTPVVLDASGGRLRTEIQVISAGGSVEIGSVQYWDPGAGSESPGTETQALTEETVVTTTDATCVDGVISGTRQACATTEAPVDCTAANDMSDGCPNMGDEASAPAALVIPPTAAALLNQDADATEPMGLPALNAPDQIACAVAEGHGHGHHRRGH